MPLPLLFWDPWCAYVMRVRKRKPTDQPTNQYCTRYKTFWNGKVSSITKKMILFRFGWLKRTTRDSQSQYFHACPVKKWVVTPPVLILDKYGIEGLYYKILNRWQFGILSKSDNYLILGENSTDLWGHCRCHSNFSFSI